MRFDDNRCNIYKRKNQVTAPRAACRSSVNARSRSRPRWPSCLRWASSTGSARRPRSLSPCGAIRASTIRRSLVSRQREIRPRFSMRSRRRVMSGSCVIMRLAISPHGRPPGDPLRIRSTLYWLAERPSVFRTLARPRERISVVRSRSRNTTSSGHGRRLLRD